MFSRKGKRFVETANIVQKATPFKQKQCKNTKQIFNQHVLNVIVKIFTKLVHLVKQIF